MREKVTTIEREGESTERGSFLPPKDYAYRRETESGRRNPDPHFGKLFFFSFGEDRSELARLVLGREALALVLFSAFAVRILHRVSRKRGTSFRM
jgi:hypothetical protein